MIKRFFERNWGYIVFTIYVLFVVLTFKLAEVMAYYICNITLEDMTNALKFILTLLFSTLLLPALKKGAN